MARRESDPAARRWSPRSKMTLAIGSLAVFLVALELTVIALAFPDIEAAFPATSRSVLVWVFTAFNIVVASLLLPGGWLADRYGRKRTFLTGFLVFVAGSVVAGVAFAPAILITGRVVQAIGGALTLPSSLALILDATPSERREVAIGLWGAAAGLAAAAGPTVGAVIVDQFGWRSVFLLNLPIGLVACWLGARHLVDVSEQRDRSRVDLVAVPAVATGVALRVLAMSAGAARGWASPAALGPVSIAVALVVVFFRRTWRHPEPLITPDILSDRHFAVAAGGTLLFVAGFTGWLVIAPTFLIELWDYSVLQAGLAIAPGPILMAAVAGPAGRVAAVRGHRPVILCGALLSAAALGWWLTTLDSTPDYGGAMLPGLVLLGVGVGCAFPMLTGAALSNIDVDRYGVAAAGNTTVRQLAMALGIALAIAVVGEPNEASDRLSPYRTSWTIDLAVIVAAVACTSLLPGRADNPPRRRPRPAAQGVVR